MRVSKVLLPPLKNWFFGPKPPNVAQNWHFRQNMGIFGPFDIMPDQKIMPTSCLGGFFVIWVPKLLLTPIKIRIFGPFRPMPDQKTIWTSYPGGFSVMWVPKLLLTPIRTRVFGPKPAKFGPKYAFLVILGQIMAFLIHLVLCPTIEIIRTRCVGGFLICGYQNFYLLP